VKDLFWGCQKNYWSTTWNCRS